MTDKNRYAHASGRHLDFGIKYLFGFGFHFPFFLGVTIIKEHIDMGNDVKGDLLGELFRCWRISYENSLGLGP